MQFLSKRTIVVFVVLSFLTSCGSILYINSVREYTEFSANYMGVRTKRQICVPFTLFGVGPPDIGTPWRSHLMQWLVDEGFAVVPDGNRPWVATSYFAPKKGGKLDCQRFVDMLLDDSWVDWSKENREVADALWPVVVSLARHSTEGILVAERLLHEVDLLRQQGETRFDVYSKLVEKHGLPVQ